MSPFQDRSDILPAVEGQKMGDESTGQGGQRPEFRSGFIDEACSRFETAWRAGLPPRIEDFLPVESADKSGATLLNLLAQLVGIDLEWRWKTAETPAETQTFAGQEACPAASGSSVAFSRRPRLADYVARYAVLGPVEQLPNDLIVAEYYARRRYGDQPTHAEYLDAFGSRHPDLAKQLQAIDDGMAAAEHLPSDLVSDDGPPLGSAVQYFGDYILLERLGKGGMGVVYKAQQVSLKRVVAVKMILAGQLADAQDIVRFHLEAEAAASLDHPNIVQIYEIGEHQGQHYFSMRYVEGESLADRLKTCPLPAREAARFIEQVARAIAYAHGRGVIHRDLKPANILVDRQNQPHVTDFGLARRVQGDSSLTATGVPLGTASYMPPEQAAGRLQQISERSDVYSLGATLYALLVGRPPFQADNFWDTVVQVREQEPVSLRQLNPKLPRDLETICAKCLEKDQQRRYSTATEFADELRRFLDGKPIHARPVSRPERFWRWCKRQPVVAGLAAAAVAILLAGTVVSLSFAIAAQRSEKNAVAGWTQADQNAKTAQNKAKEAEEQKNLAKDQLLRARTVQYSMQIGLAQRDLLEGNWADAEEMLDRCAWDLRGWEHRYLWTNVCKRRILFKGHTGWVAQETLKLRGHTGWVSSMVFSPDGKRIVSGNSDNTLKVWDAVTGQEVLTLKRRNGGVSSVAFSPDGKRIVSGGSVFGTPGEDSGKIDVWDAATGQETLTLKLHTGEVSSLAFSPDGRRIVASGSVFGKPGELEVWDAVTGQETLALKLHTGGANLAFSPDGRKIAGSVGKTVKVWDAATGEETLTLKGHTSGVNSVAFSPDSRQIVSGSDDMTVMTWDAGTGQAILTLLGHPGPILRVFFSPDGRRIFSASGPHARTVYMYRTEANRVVEPRRGYSFEGTAAVKVWDACTGQEMLALTGHSDEIRGLVSTRDGRRIMAFGVGETLSVWDAATGQETHTLKEDASTLNGYGGVGSVAFSPDGRWIVSASGAPDHDYVGGNATTVKVWNAETGQESLRLKGHTGQVCSVAVSPNGRQIASGGDAGFRAGEIKVWDAATGQKTLSLVGHTTGVNSVAFSPDGRRIVSGGGGLGEPGEIKVWDVASGQKTLTLKGHTGGVSSVAFSPDGRRIVSGGGGLGKPGEIKIWDAAAGQETLTLKGHTDRVSSVAFSPDGRRILSGSYDGTVKVWNAATGQETLTLIGHTGRVFSVALSPDGRWIVSGSADHTLKVWDGLTGQETLTLIGHTDRVFSVAFSPDGRWIVSGSADHTLKVWDVATRQKAPDTQAASRTDLPEILRSGSIPPLPPDSAQRDSPPVPTQPLHVNSNDSPPLAPHPADVASLLRKRFPARESWRPTATSPVGRPTDGK